MGQLAQDTDNEDSLFISSPVELDFFRNKKILKIACGKMHALVLCENNELYSWGVNDDFALGREGVEEEGIQRVEIPSSEEIIDICAGASYSAILTIRSNGKATAGGCVWTCGTFKSTNGIFGYDPHNKFGIGFQRVPTTRGIVSITAGMNHLLMIDRNNEIWSMGANESYQLGRKHRLRNIKYILVPTIISRARDSKFTSVSCGAYHSFAVNENGEAYSWGSNCNGQLGNGTLEPQDLKYQIEIEGVEEVACGLNHTIIRTKNNKIYGCGENAQQQLSNNTTKSTSASKSTGASNNNSGIITSPTLIATGFSRIRSGADFIVLEKNNKLYTQGINVECECGLPNETEEVKKLSEIKHKFSKIVDYQCGGNFTLVHTEK